MKNKITLLIIASVIGLIAFSVIQAYLVNNTYKLKRESFVGKSQKATALVDENSSGIDSVNAVIGEKILNLLISYKTEKTTRDSICYKLRTELSFLQNVYLNSYKSLLSKKKIDYSLKFQKTLNFIVILDSLENDTIFTSTPNTKFHLLGNEFELEKGYRVGKSLVNTSHSFVYEKNGESIHKNIIFEFETENLMDIDGWEKSVFGQMKGVLAVSILIFLFVFGLLFYSIKNLITQKKIADLKTDFVNNITHEFKTPLTTLSLATKMLRKQAEKEMSASSQETANVIERQSKRLQNLTDQVFKNTSHYQEIQLKKEMVIMHDYLNTLLNDFSISANNIVIVRQLEIETTTVLLDKFYFTTAILNLLENAVKYNRNGVEIFVNANSSDKFVISIQDNGIGISEKNQVHLFEKFFRVGNQKVHNVKGLGLGLYYTSQIVKAHGGEIRIESKENKGAEFIIEIPFE